MTSSSKLYRHAKPLRDIVGEKIRDAIHDGTFPPGSRLVERELAERFEVSRLPVREALRSLLNDGIAEHLPTRGLVVRTMDRTHVNELFDVREALEAVAAAQAAIRIAQGASNPLPATLAEARNAADPEAAHAAGSRFHDQIMELAGNSLLTEVLEPLVGQVGWLRRRIGGLDETLDEHDALGAAISSGDPQLAADAAREHVRASRARTLAILD